jgi:hypothetical protein
MTQPGVYTTARRVLLDALDALHDHRDAVILVGAQAIYLQTEDSDFDITASPYTRDADLALDPSRLGDEPRLVDAMQAAGFHLRSAEPGIWVNANEIPVDLLVPAAYAPANHGRRDARLPGHGDRATRLTPGLEAALLDNDTMTIGSLEPDLDPRTVQVRVAGAAALLVAKAHKLDERINDAAAGRTHRPQPKDAGDIVRLMRSGPTAHTVGTTLGNLANDPNAGSSVRAGLDALARLFGVDAGAGIDLAATALAGAMTRNEIVQLATAYIGVVARRYDEIVEARA